MKRIAVLMLGAALTVGLVPTAFASSSDAHSPAIERGRCADIRSDWLYTFANWDSGFWNARRVDREMKKLIAQVRDSRTKALMEQFRIDLQDGSASRDLFREIEGRLNNRYC